MLGVLPIAGETQKKDSAIDETCSDFGLTMVPNHTGYLSGRRVWYL